MVVRVGLPVLVHIAPQDGVGVGVSLGVDLPVPVDEGVAALGRGDGVHHDGEIPGGGVFHADGDLDAAGREAVLLVLHRARADGNVGQHVVEVLVILGVEHLVRAGEARLPEDAHVQLPDGDEALEHIRPCVRVGLVEHALVPLAGGAGLVRVAAGHDEDALGDLLLRLPQAAHIVEDAVLPVGGAGPDDEQQAVVLPGEYLLYLDVPLLEGPLHLRREGVHLLDLHGDGQPADKFQIHSGERSFGFNTKTLTH